MCTEHGADNARPSLAGRSASRNPRSHGRGRRTAGTGSGSGTGAQLAEIHRPQHAGQVSRQLSHSGCVLQGGSEGVRTHERGEAAQRLLQLSQGRAARTGTGA
jgi:hypothetical protein